MRYSAEEPLTVRGDYIWKVLWMQHILHLPLVNLGAEIAREAARQAEHTDAFSTMQLGKNDPLRFLRLFSTLSGQENGYSRLIEDVMPVTGCR